MNQKTKQCQNCQQNFTIEPEDFEFYNKIKVPAPTFCFHCRLQRRFTYRNERALYKNKCGLCGLSIISMCAPDSKFVSYCQKCWYSDNWDAIDYGIDFDFSKSFFQQFFELQKKIPRINFYGTNNQNSDYANNSWNSKNIYLSISALDSEDIMYSRAVDKSMYCIDCLHLTNSELCYECIDVDKSYKSTELIESRNCIDSQFLFDAANCTNCFMSANLRNKEYVIKNKQYTKEEYQQEIKKFDTGSDALFSKLKNQFINLVKNSLHKYANIIKADGCVGDTISNSKNVKNSFYVFDSEDSKNCLRGHHLKDVYDANNLVHSEIIYEGNNVGFSGYNLKFITNVVTNVSNIDYSDSCHSSSNLFACIGLRNKQYCILNKQYTKEEYEQLVPKIIEHMNNMPYIDKKGRIYKYGEFFPPELSPFSYNETIAQEYFPLTKEQAIEKGYNWKDSEERNIQINLKSEDLPDHIKDVNDDILTKIIECSHNNTNCNEQCTTAFKIIKPELDFYRKMNLPLPRLCPNCRHYQRLKQRNPLKLWKRQCQCNGNQSDPSTSSGQVYQNTATHQHGTEPCPNTFETTYNPDRPEIVYCEHCYQQEVV